MAGEDLSERPEVRDVFVAYQRLPGAGSEMLELLRAAIRVRGARPDVALGADELRRVQLPVQVIWGERDPFGPPDVGRHAADLLPQGEFLLVPGGHGPWFSHADVIGPPLSRFIHVHRTHEAHHERSTTT
jgi:pimeloyl-ACP methyl ester carboxylesterase